MAHVELLAVRQVGKGGVGHKAALEVGEVLGTFAAEVVDAFCGQGAWLSDRVALGMSSAGREVCP